MAAIHEERERNVVPRWRNFYTTAELGELGRFRSRDDPGPLQDADLSALEVEFGQHKLLPIAGDLLSGAVISRNFQVAREAAEFVLSEGGALAGPALKSLAMTVLSRRSPLEVPDVNYIGNDDQTRRAIAAKRRFLHSFPSDAVQWMDLARVYAIAGFPKQAERCVRIAAAIAPANRFIARSAGRFFLHQHDYDSAYAVIRKAVRVQRTDPWIVAAEIAIATACKKMPLFVRQGRDLLNSENYRLSDITELASAIGTEELKSGSTSKAKKLVRLSLRAPNENSLAQAKWISSELGENSIKVDVTEFKVAKPFEADTRQAYFAADWQKSDHFNAGLV